MKNVLTERLGIEFPIFAFTHCRDVAAAVSKAGGIGILGAAGHTPEQLEIDLTWMEEQLGGKPYGVDMLIPARYVGSDTGDHFSNGQLAEMIPSEYRQFLDGMMERYNVPPDDQARANMLSIGDENIAPLLEVAFAHNPKVFASALGSPPEWLIERAHAKGMLVGALAGAPRHAIKHKQAGCDFVIAQGWEAGGHTGEIASMVLTPQVVDAVAPLPVLAAGGIGSGRQMAAAMALGASGVWCGSIWLTTEEASELPIVKEKLLKATSLDTTKVRCMTGKPVRQLKSAWTEEWERDDTPEPLEMPLQSMLVNPYMSRINHAVARKEPSPGAADLVNSPVGQIVGMMTETKPAGKVVLDMIEEFIATNERVSDAVNA